MYLNVTVLLKENKYQIAQVCDCVIGQSVGVLIPDSISDAEKQRFEKFLNELTAMRLQVGV